MLSTFWRRKKVMNKYLTEYEHDMENDEIVILVL